MLQGQVFLIERLVLFYLMFSRFLIFTFRNYSTLCKWCYTFEEKYFFSATITLRKKSYSKLSKQEPAYACKEGWRVGLWQEGACLQEGGVTEGTI